MLGEAQEHRRYRARESTNQGIDMEPLDTDIIVMCMHHRRAAVA